VDPGKGEATKSNFALEHDGLIPNR
jgi:hypothetical protein